MFGQTVQITGKVRRPVRLRVAVINMGATYVTLHWTNSGVGLRFHSDKGLRPFLRRRLDAREKRNG